MKTSLYHRPRTLEEALRLKASDPDARFIAGGTDVMVGDSPPATLISLRSVPGLAGIESDGIESGGAVPGGTTRIGALATVTDLLAHEGVAGRYPAITQACRLFASVQIRNAATVGGNLCNASPAADLAPPLLIHEARVRLSGPGGTRDLPLEEFLLGPGQTALAEDELLTEILLDAPAPDARAVFLRKSRVRMDIALASVAALMAFQGDVCRRARLAAGAVAPVPLRLREVERLLTGATITPELVAEASELAVSGVRPVDDLRTTAAYRRRLVGVYVKRAIEELSP